MRPSNRSDILAAALRVVDRADGADITYDSVAREAGLTKAGLMYHFPSKDAMMIAIIEHVVARWQTELLEVLGVPLEESTLEDRVRAFVHFAGSGGVTQGEFVVFSEAVRRPALSQPWLDYLRRWFDFGAEGDPTPLLLVWLATNGLWISEATGVLEVSDAQRERLVALMLRVLDGEPGS